MSLSDYEQVLLTGWEDVFKKSQLTLWLLLALKDGEKHTAQIDTFMREATDESIVADTQSMYRALRRLADAGMVAYRQQPNDKGPERKVYMLTESGGRVLQEFLQRNIINVLYKPSVQALIRKGK